MTFSPILARELRVAARKRSTFWLRLVVALVALVLGTGWLLLTAISGASAVRMGAGLFGTLTWIAAIPALAAGIFLTSDCLSEEKREGTLGFLFLTDLKAYDLVMGKLAVTSLRGAVSLLALFPVLALTLVMGGVTGGQFWKTSLALGNVLFCSLGAGMVISSLSRDAQKAMAGTFLLLVLWTFGGVLMDLLHRLLARHPVGTFWSLTSPGYAFIVAGAWSQKAFWPSLWISHLLGWLCLALACFVTPRVWQERKKEAEGGISAAAYDFKYGPAHRRLALRQKLLELNPVEWLAYRQRWGTAGLWLIPIIGVGIPALAGCFDMPTPFFWVFNVVRISLQWLLCLWVPSEASRFFSDARRSGLLELICGTPLEPQTIVQGRWRALRRLFAWPIGCFLLGGIVLAPVFGLSGGVHWFGAMPDTWVLVVNALLQAISGALDFAALAWYGMWAGLTSKTPNRATMKAFILVEILPSIAFSFMLGVFLGPMFAQNGFVLIGYAALHLLMATLKNLGFIYSSRVSLYRWLRYTVVAGDDWERLANSAALQPTPPVLSSSLSAARGVPPRL